MSVENKYINPARTHTHTYINTVTHICICIPHMCTHIHTEFENGFPSPMYLLIYCEMYKMNNEKRTHLYILTAL